MSWEYWMMFVVLATFVGTLAYILVRWYGMTTEYIDLAIPPECFENAEEYQEYLRVGEVPAHNKEGG